LPSQAANKSDFGCLALMTVLARWVCARRPAKQQARWT
jgi:hypothetical protein